MLEYETMYDLFANLKVLNNLNMHWSDFVGWTLVEFMYQQVQKAIIQTIQFAQFLACSCDEVTTIDNGYWICLHAYVVYGWTKVLILICVDQIVDGSGSNNLTRAIMNSMMKDGRSSKEELSKKLLCFGANGVNMFQGGKIKVTKQIKDSWAPFSMGVHCVAHCINLVMQSLGDLTLIV
jgi:hypothetical protein